MGTRGAQGCFRGPSRRHLLSVWQTRGATRGATTQQKHHLCAAREHHVLICFCTHLATRTLKFNAKSARGGTQGCIRGSSRRHLLPLRRTRGAKSIATTHSVGSDMSSGRLLATRSAHLVAMGCKKHGHSTRKATSLYCFRILVDIALPDEQAV